MADPPKRNRSSSLPVNSLRADLCALADEIRSDLSAVAERTGRKLLAAKQQCRHGEWLSFLERCDILPRSAQRLMKYTRAVASGEVPRGLSMRQALGANTTRVSHLDDDDEENPCLACNCFPPGSTMKEQIRTWFEGRGPDPWKCPRRYDLAIRLLAERSPGVLKYFPPLYREPRSCSQRYSTATDRRARRD